MPDKSDKKLANMHYPGMRADPNEGAAPVSPHALWRFEKQIERIGEEVQRKILGASAIVLTSQPVGARVAKKLLATGLGRVGFFGEHALTGAHDLHSATPAEPVGVIASLSAWARAEAPWAAFEPFSGQSLDRQLEDIVRGFDVVIGDFESAPATLELVRQFNLNAVFVRVGARKAWCVSVPAGSLCEKCIALPAGESGAGFYYPLLDAASAYITDFVIEAVTAPRGAVLEILSAAERPWTTEVHTLKPKPGCKVCKKI